MKYICHSLFIVGLLSGTASMAHAQVSMTPYAYGTMGISATRTEIPVQTQPPTITSYADTFGSAMAAANAGVLLGRYIGVDAGLRSTFGIGRPFRAINLGARLQHGQMYTRFGVGRVQGFTEVSCVSSPCPSHVSEWTNGFDFEAGVVAWRGSLNVGPTVWWSQSTGSDKEYRSVGIGVGVHFP
jgi:hypothetical protein